MKFNNINNIEIVVRLLKENNIRDLVISPGGTNIPVIKAVQDDDYFRCYSVIDERSAVYVAIGVYLQRKHPVALICTSAQATRNYIPGLTEAYYKKVPILAITMEKHPRFKYQEYMQAPDQTSLPKDCVKRSFELPFISDINGYYQSLRMANEAFLELSQHGFGPVQLCIPWLDFPLKDTSPEFRTIRRFKSQDIGMENLADKRILLLIGEHLPFTKSEIAAINHFSEMTNSVIYVNHLSNFSSEYSIEGNLFLLTSNYEEINNIKPDILITIGGQTGDYPFYLAFSDNSLHNMEHWRICEDGAVADTYDKLTRIYQGTLIDFFKNIKSECSSHSYLKCWKDQLKLKTTNLKVPFSHISVAQYMHDKIPNNSIMQFSILNSLRIWNMFSLDTSIECYSNVGAFGIDGGLSTLIGQSLATEKLCFMVIGDLAFIYDMNSLSIREMKNNVRILLVNNNGGIEFKLNGEKKRERDKYIAAADYHGSSRGWATSCGFEYYSANSISELIDITPKFISVSEKPIVLEVFVEDYDESDAYLKIVNENTSKNLNDRISIKGVVKRIVGEKKYNKLKHSIKG